MTSGKVDIDKLIEWLKPIRFSRKGVSYFKNIARDFSDAVCVAEIIKHYFPRIVDVNNYPPASSSDQKFQNWKTLNAKVLSKHFSAGRGRPFVVPEKVINNIINFQSGVMELTLNNLKLTIDKKLEAPRKSGGGKQVHTVINPFPKRGTNYGHRIVRGRKRDGLTQSQQNKESSSYGQKSRNFPHISDMDRQMKRVSNIGRNMNSSLEVPVIHREPRGGSGRAPLKPGSGTRIRSDHPVTNQGEFGSLDTMQRRLDEQGRQIQDYEEVLDTLKKHISRLEKLVRLKDSKILALQRKCKDGGIR